MIGSHSNAPKALEQLISLAAAWHGRRMMCSVFLVSFSPSLYVCAYLYTIYTCNVYTSIYIIIYIYRKCLGFARTRNDDGRRIIIIIVIIIIIIVIVIVIIIINIMIINIIIIIVIIFIINIMIINIIIIINIIRPLLTIFNECRSLTGVGELNPYWRSSMNVEV